MVNNTSTVTTYIFGLRCQALVDVIESTELQEAVLAHTLNAKREKLQKALGMEGATVERVLKFNNSAARFIGSATRMELLLKVKISTETCGLKGRCKM